MKYKSIYFALIISSLIGCSFKQESKISKLFISPYLQLDTLIFVNSTGHYDTFYITKITENNFDTKEQIEIQEEKFKLIEVYYSENSVGEPIDKILLSNKINLITQEQTIIVYWLDFWQPMHVSDTLKFEGISILGQTFENCYCFKVSEFEYPDAINRDMVAVYYDKELGVVGYESRKSGLWLKLIKN